MTRPPNASTPSTCGSKKARCTTTKIQPSPLRLATSRKTFGEERPMSASASGALSTSTGSTGYRTSWPSSSLQETRWSSSRETCFLPFRVRDVLYTAPAGGHVASARTAKKNDVLDIYAWRSLMPCLACRFLDTTNSAHVGCSYNCESPRDDGE